MAKEKKAKRMPKTNPVPLPDLGQPGTVDPRMYNSEGQELVKCGDCAARGMYWEWVDDAGVVHHRKGRNQHMQPGGKREATKVKCRACKGAGVLVCPSPANA